MEPCIRFQLTEWFAPGAPRASLPRGVGLAGMWNILPGGGGAKGAHGTPTGLSLYPPRARFPVSTNHLV